ncbi:hypothetical protein NA78x_004000 [Anatilimnocola sp. NA78]|uniref:hypothetical protein n=1 Tax=Anatilimnocola sp. NA78 TaxID=3415683 RepID=UPI003CE52888
MVIQLTPQLQATLAEEASKLGVTPEQLAIAALQERFPAKTSPVLAPNAQRMEPQDEWERRLFSIGKDLGFSPPREWLTSENYYD